jgi:hypothetical protein
VRRVLDLLTRTHEIICVDTGNNCESGNWRTIMEAADQLVITSVPREDSAFRRRLDDGRADRGRPGGPGGQRGHPGLDDHPRPSAMQDDLVRHLPLAQPRGLRVPYDPSLEQGGWIDHTILQPAHPRGVGCRRQR